VLRKPPRLRRTRGQAVVEFAIAAPIFILVLVAVIEAGAFAFTYSSLQHAVQEGGRVAALPGTADVVDVRNRVVDRAAPVTVDPVAVSVDLNGAACDDACFDTRAPGDRIRVGLTYAYRPVSASVLGMGTFDLPSIVVEFMVE
jgi:hypothetical protein